MFKFQVENFNPDNYPEQISEDLLNKECKFFGHLCPVFFVREEVTESTSINAIKKQDSKGM